MSRKGDDVIQKLTVPGRPFVRISADFVVKLSDELSVLFGQPTCIFPVGPLFCLSVSRPIILQFSVGVFVHLVFEATNRYPTVDKWACAVAAGAAILSLKPFISKPVHPAPGRGLNPFTVRGDGIVFK